MSEVEPPLDTAPDVQAEDANPAKTDLPPDQALALLREGKPVQNARIKGLKFRGVFDKPVLFRNCTLVRTLFDGDEDNYGGSAAVLISGGSVPASGANLAFASWRSR